MSQDTVLFMSAYKAADKKALASESQKAYSSMFA